MSMFHGKNGKVVWNSEDGGSDVGIQHITSWSCDATADTAEATEMGSTDWKQYLGGFKDWTATVECNADSAGPDIDYVTNDGNEGEQGLGATWEDTDPAYLKIYLELWFTQSAAGGLLWGPAICTGISNTTDAQDVAKVTYTFQGNGTLAFTTTEPSVFT